MGWLIEDAKSDAETAPFEFGQTALCGNRRRLSKVGKTSMWRILDSHELKPHWIRYRLERQDPQLERKMAEVLVVYRDVNFTEQVWCKMHAPS